MPPKPDQVLHTLILKGSPSYSLRLSGNPPVYHEGGTSVHHLLLAPEEVRELKLLKMEGLKFELHPMEGQSPEQTQERAQLNSLGEEGRVWPCKECPTCPWFDPLVPEENFPCGLQAWPRESILELRETSVLHREAEASCPLLLERYP